MLRPALICGALAVLVTAAAAHPPPPPPPPAPPTRPTVEWSSWVRVGYGAAPHATGAARLVVGTPSDPGADRDRGWETALGADLTLPIGHGGDVRFGPFLEASTTGAAVVGGELLIAAMPRKLDMFWYEGEGVLIARAGTDGDLVTAALSYGYRAPWHLFRPTRGSSRYMIGLRAVATYTRAIDDPRQWSSTIGLEVEPVGALRYLLGIRGWY